MWVISCQLLQDVYFSITIHKNIVYFGSLLDILREKLGIITWHSKYSWFFVQTNIPLYGWVIHISCFVDCECCTCFRVGLISYIPNIDLVSLDRFYSATCLRHPHSRARWSERLGIWCGQRLESILSSWTTSFANIIFALFILVLLILVPRGLLLS